MFGIGFWEFVLIIVIALLLLGPEKIGPLMRTMGRIMREIQKGAMEMKEAFQIDEEIEKVEEIKKTVVKDIALEEEEIKKEIRETEKDLKLAAKGMEAEQKENKDKVIKKWNEMHDDIEKKQ